MLKELVLRGTWREHFSSNALCNSYPSPCLSLLVFFFVVWLKLSHLITMMEALLGVLCNIFVTVFLKTRFI